MGVAMPSLSPLSTLSARRTLPGTAGSDITVAPRAASVGASAAPISRAAHRSTSSTTSAAAVPSATVNGSPTPSSRPYRPRSRRNWLGRTRDASANSTHTRVTSAITLTKCGSRARSRISSPSASTKPAATKTIGAVSPTRCRRPASTHQPKMVARTSVSDSTSIRHVSDHARDLYASSVTEPRRLDQTGRAGRSVVVSRP